MKPERCECGGALVWLPGSFALCDRCNRGDGRLWRWSGSYLSATSDWQPFIPLARAYKALAASAPAGGATGEQPGDSLLGALHAFRLWLETHSPQPRPMFFELDRFEDGYTRALTNVRGGSLWARVAELMDTAPADAREAERERVIAAAREVARRQREFRANNGRADLALVYLDRALKALDAAARPESGRDTRSCEACAATRIEHFAGVAPPHPIYRHKPGCPIAKRHPETTWEQWIRPESAEPAPEILTVVSAEDPRLPVDWRDAEPAPPRLPERSEIKDWPPPIGTEFLMRARYMGRRKPRIDLDLDRDYDFADEDDSPPPAGDKAEG